MNDKVFFDSNIIIYLFSIDESNKKNKIENLIENYENIIISTQVINEFINVSKRKMKLEYDIIIPRAEEIIQNFENIAIINKSTLQKALSIAFRYKYDYFDCLMIAAAIENNCNILFSEDMHHGQIIENTKIINPFIHEV